MNGQDAGCQRAMERSGELLGRSEPERAWLGIGAFDAAKLTAYRGGTPTACAGSMPCMPRSNASAHRPRAAWVSCWSSTRRGLVTGIVACCWTSAVC